MARPNIWLLASLPLAIALASCTVDGAPEESVAEASEAVVGAPGQEATWSLVISTAPQLPQDVWISARGNNDDLQHRFPHDQFRRQFAAQQLLSLDGHGRAGRAGLFSWELGLRDRRVLVGGADNWAG